MTPRPLFKLIFVLIFLSAGGYAQQAQVASGGARRVSGTVADARGGEIPGANVSVVGTNTGVITDAKGKFSVDVPNSQAVLRFSFIGYKNTEVTVGNKDQFAITMEEDAKNLEQLVVIGYGSQKKKDLTGAISSVSHENLNLGGVTSNVAQALQGRASGVQVSQANAAPGGSTVVRIRGGNSISSTNEPLYVVDGFPSETGKDINPSDIEEIQVLKDASATAIYGSRGANGVVLITTRRGKAGKTVIEYDGYYGVQKIRKKPDLMNAQETMRVANEKAVELGNPAEYSAAELASNVNTDWFKLATRNAVVHNHNINISGGNDNTKISLSGNYFAQDGALRKTDYDRYSARLNVDKQFGEKFKAGASMYGSRSFSQYKTYDGNIVPSNVLYGLLLTSPVIPAYNSDGTYGRRKGRDNPLAWLLEPTNERYVNKLNANVFAEYEFIEGLYLRVNAGTEYATTKEGNYLPTTLISGEKVKGQASVNDISTTRNLLETYLTYKRNFGNAHSLTALAGFSRQSDVRDAHYTQVQKFTTDTYLYYNLGGGAERIAATSSRVEAKLASFYGRLNYGFKDKYLATFTLRSDASSRFGPNNRVGYFPSGSVAWRIIDEDFMKGSKVFSDLKFRAGYGVTGNDRIGDYIYMSTFGPTGVSLGTGSNLYGGVVATRASNPDLKWESTAQTNVGVDMGFRGGKISVTADYYHKKTNDLIMDIPIGQWWGFSTQTVNAGSIENKGVELSITSRNISANNFKWTTTLNVAYNKQKATDLGGRPYIRTQTANPDGAVPSADFTELVVGRELSEIFGYVYQGVVQKGETYAPQPLSKPGEPKYKDLNGDGAITTADRQVLGKANPHYILGFNNDLAYKGFELNLFFQGALDYSLYNMNRLLMETYSGKNALDRWTPTHTDTNTPSNGYFTSKYGGYVNSRFVENASYLRLKTLTLAYTIPLSKIGMRSVRIYATGQDLLTFTKYSGTDPEVNTNGGDANLRAGLDFNAYPAFRSYTVGLKLNF